MEGWLLSVAIEVLRCSEVAPFAPAPSWESEESAGGGCGCWSLAAAFFANVFSFALLRKKKGGVRTDREDEGILSAGAPVLKPNLWIDGNEHVRTVNLGECRFGY